MSGEADRRKATDAASRRRRGVRSSIFSRGEGLIWFTGGAQGFGLMMILGLMVLIVWQGMVAFWPLEIERHRMRDGSTLMGERTREETFVPDETTWIVMDEEEQALARRHLEDGTLPRFLVRTGNYDLTNTHFTWVRQWDSVEVDHPEWAITVEREKWGRFYGFPEAFLVDGEAVAGKPSEVWTRFHAHHDEVLEREDEIEEIEEFVIGAENARINDAKLEVDQLQALRDRAILVDESRMRSITIPQGILLGLLLALLVGAGGAGIFARLKAGGGAELAGFKPLPWLAGGVLVLFLLTLWFSKVETEVPGEAAIAAAKERAAAVAAEAEEVIAEAKTRTAELRAENDRYAVLFRTADGAEKEIAVGGIVRAYPANQFGFGDRLGVYWERWMEFLWADPRESNMEGGIFPALIGTVVMTLLMTVVAVPFGVLAALYLREYAQGGPIVSILRIAINNLAGVPSIVFGVFGLGFFCYFVGGWVDAGPRGAVGTADYVPITAGEWLLAITGVGASVILAVMLAGIKDSTSRGSKNSFGFLPAFAAAVFLVDLFAISWVGIWAMAGYLVLLAAVWGITLSRFRSPLDAHKRLPGLLSGTVAVLWIKAVLLCAWFVFFNPFFDGFYLGEQPNPRYGTGGILGAALTLALLSRPVVIVTTEEALAAVPGSMREGSYACGASKWQTIKRIVLPRAMPGVLTGMILAMARGAGEVAPLMLVGALKQAPKLPVELANWTGDLGPLPTGPLHPDRSFMHLGFHIYDLALQSPNAEATRPMVYTTTLLLITLIVVLTLLAIWGRNRLSRRFVGGNF